MKKPAPPEQKLHQFDWRPVWSGRRVKEVLREVLPGLSSRSVVLVVSNGLVRAGDEVVDNLDTLLLEERPLVVDLRHGVRGERPSRNPALIERIRVVYEDDDIVVISKAAGVVVQPEEEGLKSGGGPPVIELLKHYWKRRGGRVDNPYLVQRLDKETSGLMVLARTVPAQRFLQKHATSRAMERHYIAVVFGLVEPDSGTWHSWFGTDEEGRRVSVAQSGAEAPAGAQEAITHFRVLERLRNATVLDVRLETGRTHQIRIHCAEAGHPVLGDRVYSGLGCRLHPGSARDIKAVRVERMMLHAVRLKFQHPSGRNRWLTFRDELPQPVRDLIEREGGSNSRLVKG
jgi:23S rRNA pseudouridine1911/1915/1917 synthase